MEQRMDIMKKKRKLRVKHFLVGVVLCYIGYILISQQFMMMRIQKDIEKFSQENKKVEEDNAYLRDQIEYASTDEYKERMARERIGLVKPGETVYIIDGDN
jgi:cell division protein FtsB